MEGNTLKLKVKRSHLDRIVGQPLDGQGHRDVWTNLTIRGFSKMYQPNLNNIIILEYIFSLKSRFSPCAKIHIVHFYFNVGLPVPRTSAPSTIGKPQCAQQHKQQCHAQKQLKRDMENEFHGSRHLKKLPYFINKSILKRFIFLLIK